MKQKHRKNTQINTNKSIYTYSEMDAGRWCHDGFDGCMGTYRSFTWVSAWRLQTAITADIRRSDGLGLTRDTARTVTVKNRQNKGHTPSKVIQGHKIVEDDRLGYINRKLEYATSH